MTEGKGKEGNRTEGKARQDNNIGKGMEWNKREQNKKEHNKTEGKGKEGKAARDKYFFSI